MAPELFWPKTDPIIAPSHQNWRKKTFLIREKQKHPDQSRADCQVPQITARATESIPEAHFELFRDWQ
jgi:hypothetical protein